MDEWDHTHQQCPDTRYFGGEAPISRSTRTTMAHSSTYPTLEDGGNYYELTMPIVLVVLVLSVLMFAFVATIVWGGLAFLLRVMLEKTLQSSPFPGGR